MLGVWLVLLGGLALGCRGERAFLTRADDSTGRCTYSFTVASPVEAACPSAGGGLELRAELASLAARLSRLESRERGAGGSGPRGVEAGGARDSQQASPAGGLEDAYGELLQAKSRLEEEKGRLERENAELRRRLESSAQEIARLRATPCSPGGEEPDREALRVPGKGKGGGRGAVSSPGTEALQSLFTAACAVHPLLPRSWGPRQGAPLLQSSAGGITAHCTKPPPIPKSGLAARAHSSHHPPCSRGGNAGNCAHLGV